MSTIESFCVTNPPFGDTFILNAEDSGIWVVVKGLPVLDSEARSALLRWLSQYMVATEPLKWERFINGEYQRTPFYNNSPAGEIAALKAQIADLEHKLQVERDDSSRRMRELADRAWGLMP